MVGLHHWFNGHEVGQTLGDSECCKSQRVLGSQRAGTWLGDNHGPGHVLITDDLAKLIAYSLVRWAKQKQVIMIQFYNKAYWESIMKIWGPTINLPEYSSATQSNLVTTIHMWLFKLLKIKYMKSSVPGLHQPATFQQLESYMWLVAVISDSVDIEHFSHCRKF